MMRPASALTLLLLALASGSLSAQQGHDLAPFLGTVGTADVALARSAAPAAISDSASVLVLTRNGFEQVARGSNGFTCVVLASFFADPGDPDFWNPKIRAPHCLNAPAMATVFPEMKRRAEWVLAGLSPDEIKRKTAAAYASGELPMPAPGAMAYMLSPRQYLADRNPHWLPHLMFYYPGSMAGALWGAGGVSSPIIDASSDNPKAPVRVLLVPVGHWSDGTVVAAAMSH